MPQENKVKLEEEAGGGSGEGMEVEEEEEEEGGDAPAALADAFIPAPDPPPLPAGAPCGTHNAGNNCFAIAALAALAASGELVAELAAHRAACPAGAARQPCIPCALHDYLAKVRAGGFVNAGANAFLVAIIKHLRFDYGQQEDPSEFIVRLLPHLGAQVNELLAMTRVECFSPCPRCTLVPLPVVTTVAAVVVTPLPAASGAVSTLGSLLNEPFGRQHVIKKCYGCLEEQHYNTQVKIVKPPRVLFAILRRFKGEGRSAARHNGLVDSSGHVNLNGHCIPPPVRAAADAGAAHHAGGIIPATYIPTAIVTHQGRTPQSGHCTAVVVCPAGVCYILNDNTATPTTSASALGPSLSAYVVVLARDGHDASAAVLPAGAAVGLSFEVSAPTAAQIAVRVASDREDAVRVAAQLAAERAAASRTAAVAARAAEKARA
ncbi:MAG: ubiquitin carboxyl-terminal hydrolase, partial [Planctomycetes bacterium]|nr:ubiquitin carboxyl-terminal hydrolase [Planctomycetota bacterium]